ncbi:uncharacterized protein LOC108110745 [Drosophila eugracilis]|uniref:uncharacterized protein LOC108110745 n=1 Tax=Drosophila eugracilis TaxID=29029 RepID=UPI0007E76283|nr:uncharacterized protein LOC108110745 [Drosophila eugracilis]
MSTASRLTLAMAVSVSTAIIGYVHYKQSADRLRLHDGVLRDVEQQQRRKHENTYTLQQQIDITKHLKAREASSNPSDTPVPALETPSESNIQEEIETNPTPSPNVLGTGLQPHPEQAITGDVPLSESVNQEAPSPTSDIA